MKPAIAKLSAWKNATQTVFGEGGSKARIMLVGERPGTMETSAENLSLELPGVCWMLL